MNQDVIETKKTFLGDFGYFLNFSVFSVFSIFPFLQTNNHKFRRFPQKKNTPKSFFKDFHSGPCCRCRSPQMSKFSPKRQKAYDTRDSQAVSDPSTNRARRCLTWQIGRDAVFSTWYGRKRLLAARAVPNSEGGERRDRDAAKHQATRGEGATTRRCAFFPCHFPENTTPGTRAVHIGAQRPSASV